MKKVLYAIVAVVAFAALSHAGPTAPVPQPASRGGALMDIKLFGGNTFRVESSTPADQAVLLATGSGVIFDASCSSGTANGWLVLFDSASINGITASPSTTGLALTGQIFTNGSSTTTNTASAFLGQWIPSAAGVRFNNGLVAEKHGDGGAANCYVHGRLDATNAANTLGAIGAQ